MSGHLNDLSTKQEASLYQFKQALSDVLEKKHDDYILLQFLRARCFDLKKSEEMFRKHLEWRRRFPEEYYISDYKPPELLKKYVCPPFLGFDKGGSPVRFIPMGELDIVGITSTFRLNELKHYVISCLDGDKRAAKKYNEKFGRHVETRTFIFDLKNVTLRQVTFKPVIDTIGSFLKLYEANYPENLKVAYVVNVPYFFAWLFNLVKSILTEETVKKIKIFGKDGWKEEILTVMNAEILPITLGGTRTDPDGDPICPSLYCDKGPIPTYHYLKNQRKLSKENDEVRQIHVGRRDKKEVEICIIDPGATILWDAESLDNDLFFSLIYKKITPSNEIYNEEVVRSAKFGGDYGPTCGSYQCKRKGKYALVFDNTFSILRGKQVLYRLNVMKAMSSLSNEITELKISGQY